MALGGFMCKSCSFYIAQSGRDGEELLIFLCCTIMRSLIASPRDRYETHHDWCAAIRHRTMFVRCYALWLRRHRREYCAVIGLPCNVCVISGRRGREGKISSPVLQLASNKSKHIQLTWSKWCTTVKRRMRGKTFPAKSISRGRRATQINCHSKVHFRPGKPTNTQRDFKLHLKRFIMVSRGSPPDGDIRLSPVAIFISMGSNVRSVDV